MCQENLSNIILGNKAIQIKGNHICVKAFLIEAIVPQLSKCLKFEAIWGVLTDQMI